MGKEDVEKGLRERQNELFDEYHKRLKNLQFDRRVKKLARIRVKEGPKELREACSFRIQLSNHTYS
jgi:predicted ArsR family transcriptional regulator